MQPVLQARGIRKSFSSVEVLHGVDLDLLPGSVHAVVGENGAGKSTLVKILSGVHRRDGGTVAVNGRPVEALSPQKAQALGIVTIYQERNLIPYLSVAENLLLGAVPTGPFGVVKWGEMVRQAGEILERLRLDLDPRTTVANLGPAEQQAVEIAKAMRKQARVVIMDEPTASLAGAEIDNLFRLICDLRNAGVAIVYISHRLDEIFQIVNEVTVLRDGLRVLHSPIEKITKDELVKAMVGEEITLTHIPALAGGRPLLHVAALSDGETFEGVDLHLHGGQVVALAGAQGSGRTQVLQALAGLRPIRAGCIEHQGEQLQGKRLADFIRRGVCFVPGERDQMGLIMPMSVAGNITLASLGSITRGPVLNLRGENEIAATYVRQLNIQLKHPGQEVQYLSGGNRQKVMLSKWLHRGVEVFLLDEPTQGVDVGAREEIHRIMKQLLEEGKGIIMVTSDLEELMNMSHVIVVMSKGRVVATLQTQKTTAEEVLSYALGQRKQSEPCA